MCRRERSSLRWGHLGPSKLATAWWFPGPRRGTGAWETRNQLNAWRADYPKFKRCRLLHRPQRPKVPNVPKSPTFQRFVHPALPTTSWPQRCLHFGCWSRSDFKRFSLPSAVSRTAPAWRAARCLARNVKFQGARRKCECGPLKVPAQLGRNGDWRSDSRVSGLDLAMRRKKRRPLLL